MIAETFPFGLPATSVAKIRAVFARYPAIAAAILYGSRAKGNFKPGSDVDLTLVGSPDLNRLLPQIAEALDDLLLTYTIDLSVWADLNNPPLREHIQRVGVRFY